MKTHTDFFFSFSFFECFQVIADELLWKAVRESSTIQYGASEEDPVVRTVGDDTNGFCVCWDPLDGSSIVDNNWAVGTIVGVWPRHLINTTGRDQVASLVALYGPRTTVLVTLDDGVYEFSLLQGQWLCTRHAIQISADCKILAPANLRSAQELPAYQALLDYYFANRYTLRYTGGMVPDIYQQFTKGQGVFVSPVAPESPPKLRLAFEAAPFGLLVEKAGGKTSDCAGQSILDVVITSVDQRTAVCMGSSNEVDRFHEYLNQHGQSS